MAEAILVVRDPLEQGNLAGGRVVGAGESCGHEVQIVGVYEDIVEVPVERVSQVLDQLFVNPTDWLAASTEDFGTMLDDLPESDFIWADSVDRITFPRLYIFYYQIRHVLSMHELKIIITVSRHSENRKSLD